MIRWFTLLSSLAAVAASLGTLHATPMVLLSSPDDLSAVPVGASVTVQVELAGLNPGQELDALATSVSFPVTFFDVPNISPGPIVPDPLNDPLDLLIVEDAGLADVTFLTLGLDSADHITANGLFFEFTVTAQQLGTGEFGFAFGGATYFNSANPGAPIDAELETGPPLPFTVVPEPVSCWICLCCLAGIRRSPGRGR